MECSLYEGEVVASTRERVDYKTSIVALHWWGPLYVFISSTFNYYANSLLGRSCSWMKEVLQGYTCSSSQTEGVNSVAILTEHTGYLYSRIWGRISSG
jgi:hypothetical protein